MYLDRYRKPRGISLGIKADNFSKVLNFGKGLDRKPNLEVTICDLKWNWRRSIMNKTGYNLILFKSFDVELSFWE